MQEEPLPPHIPLPVLNGKLITKVVKKCIESPADVTELGIELDFELSEINQILQNHRDNIVMAGNTLLECWRIRDTKSDLEKLTELGIVLKEMKKINIAVKLGIPVK